jgi:hypothetical protein
MVLNNVRQNGAWYSSCHRAVSGAHQLLQNFLELRIRVDWVRQLANDVALSISGDLTLIIDAILHGRSQDEKPLGPGVEVCVAATQAQNHVTSAI